MSFVRCVLAAITLALAANLSKSAVAEDDVTPLSLVSDSAAVCLEVPRFEGTWTKFRNSRLLTRIREFPQAERFLNGAAFQKWMMVEEYVRKSSGKSLSEHLVGAVSESLVVAVYLPERMQPAGVVIAQSRDTDALKQTLKTWASLEPQQVSQSKEHQGYPYTRRAKSAKSAEVVYYVTFGRTIALSDHEELIHQVIELRAATQKTLPDKPRLLRDHALYQANRARMPADAAAYLFLNTRRWDTVVDEALRQSPDAAWVQRVFRHVAAVSASLRLDDEVVLDLVADTTGSEMPAMWQAFVAATKGGGDWQRRVPMESIASLSSRMDIQPLIRAWMTVTPETKSDDFARGRKLLTSVLLGRDVFADVLPTTLRDWTLSLVSVTDAPSDMTPVNAVGQFSWEGAGPADQRPALHQCVDNALQFGATLLGAMLSHQRPLGASPAVVESETTSAGVVRSLSGLRVWSPSYLATPQRLIVASTRQGLQAAMDSPKDPQASRLATCERRYFGSATQLAWLDAVRLRALLARRSDWIASQLAPDSTDSRERVQVQLSKIEEVAKVFDAAFLAAKLEDDHVRLIVGAALDRSE